jgi:putative acetyltransferase
MNNLDHNVKQRPATNGDREAIKSLVFGVLAEFSLSPDVNGTDSDLNDIEASYLDRGGSFEVLESADGEIVASVGLYPLDDQTIELRKMYLAPKLRGHGLGRKLLYDMIEKARNLGYLRVYLETASVLSQAVHIYETAGFHRVDGKHTPRCDQAYVLELERR